MDFKGKYSIPARPAAVWSALHEPEMLAASIPGCEGVEKLSATEFKARAVIKIGPVKARFEGKVELRDLEPTARGPYSGAVGYLTFEGDLDFCITIRTATVANGYVSVQAGAGIVADSDPATELAESKAKMSALMPAISEGAQ
jgi:anthranilate synthase component 1